MEESGRIIIVNCGVEILDVTLPREEFEATRKSLIGRLKPHSTSEFQLGDSDLIVIGNATLKNSTLRFIELY